MVDRNAVVTRRDFLVRTSAGLAALSSLASASRPVRAGLSAEGPIIHRTLGRTGIRVPIVSMGVMNASNPELIPHAYDAGVRLFDTAMGYQGGRNEEMVGSAIEKLGVRDQVIIVTKISTPRAWGGILGTAGESEAKQKVLDNAAGCLRRLRTDYIDVLLLHNVSSREAVHNAGVLSALAELKGEKKARFIGVSTHSNQAEVLNEVAGMDVYDVVLTSFNFTMAANTALMKAIEGAAGKGIGIIAMKTQAGGRVWKSLSPGNQTAALKWVLRNDHVTTAVPGYTSFAHIEEDFPVARNLELTPEERNYLADKGARAAVGFCQQCHRCVPSCPRAVDIPSLMRAHMYAAQYANCHEARAALDGVERERGLSVCRSCGSCTARCVAFVDVRGRIEELRRLYVQSV